MRPRLWWAILPLIAAPVQAQNAPCDLVRVVSARVGNVCDAAIDGTRGFHPVAGLLVSGGNPVLQTQPGAGGLGRFAVAIRANAARVQLPDLSYDGTTETVPAGDRLLFIAPSVEGSAGLYALPGRLAVEALFSALLLPTNQVENFQVLPGGTHLGAVALGLGVGARASAVLSPSLPVLSLGLMRRSVPRVQYGDITDLSDEFQYAINLTAVNLRLAASRRFSHVALAGGIGYDHYTGDAAIAVRDPALPVNLVGTVRIGLKTSRWLLFANPSVEAGPLQVTGELGYQLPREQKLGTTFEGFDPSSGRLFGGLGVRVDF
jgi:hypothetical protein